MNSIKALLRLELKAKFGSINLREWKSVVKLFVILSFSILIYTVYIFGAKSFLISFYIYDMEFIFLILFMTLADTLLFFSGISTIGKSLFFSGDNEILLRFPVKGTDVFVSKIILVFIIQSITTIIIMLPVFILYGSITRQPYGYFLLLPLILLFCIMLPFIFANILAIPFMNLKTYLKDKYSIMLLIFIVSVAGGFAIYMASVQGVLRFMEEQSMDFFSGGFMVLLTGLTRYAVPFRQFANLLVGNNVLISLLVIVLLFSAITYIAIIIVKRIYISTMLKNIEVEGSCFIKESKNKQKSLFITLINREFIDIFRSSNYSFQYLALAFGAPVMVYFCNRLAVFIGETNVGNGILSALTILVMLIFITLIVSFSASSISREGDNFYITKIVPVPYLLQIVVKFTLYMIVVFLSILVSIGVLVLCKYVDPLTGLLMFAICLLFAIGETCLSIKLDIKKPTFAVGGDGELTAGNLGTFVSMFIGLAIAILSGIFGMVFSYFWNVNNTLYVLLIAAAVLAGSSFFWLFYKLDRAYARIMQR